MNWTEDDSQWEDYKVCWEQGLSIVNLRFQVEVRQPTTLSCQATKVCLKQSWSGKYWCSFYFEQPQVISSSTVLLGKIFSRSQTASRHKTKPVHLFGS